jgi:hypothetical protein
MHYKIHYNKIQSHLHRISKCITQTCNSHKNRTMHVCDAKFSCFAHMYNNFFYSKCLNLVPQICLLGIHIYN